MLKVISSKISPYTLERKINKGKNMVKGNNLNLLELEKQFNKEINSLLEFQNYDHYDVGYINFENNFSKVQNKKNTNK